MGELKLIEQFVRTIAQKGIVLNHDQTEVARAIFAIPEGRRMFTALRTGKTFLLSLLETFAHDIAIEEYVAPKPVAPKPVVKEEPVVKKPEPKKTTPKKAPAKK